MSEALNSQTQQPAVSILPVSTDASTQEWNISKISNHPLLLASLVVTVTIVAIAALVIHTLQNRKNNAYIQEANVRIQQATKKATTAKGNLEKANEKITSLESQLKKAKDENLLTREAIKQIQTLTDDKTSVSAELEDSRTKHLAAFRHSTGSKLKNKKRASALQQVKSHRDSRNKNANQLKVINEQLAVLFKTMKPLLSLKTL